MTGPRLYRAAYTRRIPAVYLRYASSGPSVALTPVGGLLRPAPVRHRGVTPSRYAQGIAGTRVPRKAGGGQPAALRSRDAGPLRAQEPARCRTPRCCQVPGLLTRPSALPARPGTRQLHRRYTAGRREVHPSGLAKRRRRAAPVAGRREGDGWYTGGSSQVHARTIAGQWHRAAWERNDPRPRGAHRALVRRPLPPRPARTAPGNPHPPGLPEAAGTGPARWRPSPGRSGCWSPGRSRWPCGLGGWPRACRTGRCRWMS
jgi:hypothetical protein